MQISAMSLGKRILQARMAKKFSQEKLGKILRVSRNAVCQWEADATDPTPERLRELAVALELDYEWLATGRTRVLVSKGLPLIGEIAPGVWIEARNTAGNGGGMDMERVPVAPVPEYPPEAQYALRVKGNSVNKVAPPGTIIIVVDIERAGITPRAGDLVFVERHKGSLVENTIRRIQRSAKGLELASESDDPAHQKTLKIGPQNGSDTVIRGLVIYTVSPVARGS